MGVITIALLLTRMSGRKIGLRQRTLMQEAISAHKMGGIVRLTGFIVKMMLIFELAGAVLMYPEFDKTVWHYKRYMVFIISFNISLL